MFLSLCAMAAMAWQANVVRGEGSPWLKQLRRVETLGVYAIPEASSLVT